MKYREVPFSIVLVFLAALIVGACHPIVDPRTPADATATNVARATDVAATAEALVPTLEATPAPECLIKGNIARSGERIFHVPGQLNYERTVIDPELGEQWFCSEEEALAAGWRKALR